MREGAVTDAGASPEEEAPELWRRAAGIVQAGLAARAAPALRVLSRAADSCFSARVPQLPPGD